MHHSVKTGDVIETKVCDLTAQADDPLVFPPDDLFGDLLYSKKARNGHVVPFRVKSAAHT